MSSKFLLTGAGFSHNFNFPLARHVWGMIFNNSSVHSSKDIKELLLGNFNYEEVYSKILTDDKYQDNRELFLGIISSIFNDYFEKICCKAIYQKEKTGISYQELCNFIKLFSTENKGSGLIFTTNQDLFLERLFLANEEPDMLASPYIGNCLWNYAPGKDQLGMNLPIEDARRYDFKNDDKWLPTDDELIEKKSKIVLSQKRSLPSYIKLHGSIGWHNRGQENIPLVMGTHKTEIIKNEPIFKEYLKIFEESVFKPNASLLTIGYSFSDQHLNKIIIDAIRNYQLKVHIVNPSSIESFFKKLEEPKVMGPEDTATLYNYGLYGYYENTLKDFFPIDPPGKENYSYKSNPYEILRSNFFNRE